MRAILRVAVLALTACTAPGPARSDVGPRPAATRQSEAACSNDVVRELFGARVALTGRIIAQDSSVVLPPGFADAMYRALANRLVRVEELTQPASARVEFTVDREGKVTDGVLPRYVGPPWFAEQVMRTLASAVLTGSIPPMPREIEGAALPLVLEVRTAPVEPGWQPFPLRIALDTATVDEPAMAMPGNRAPRYPTDLRARRVSGMVVVQVIIGTDGRPDMSSVTTIRADAPEFLHAVVEHLPTMRYYTATARGCTVPAWVFQPFGFSVAPDGSDRDGDEMASELPATPMPR